jgi:hypothetical protein
LDFFIFSFLHFFCLPKQLSVTFSR